MLLPPPKEYAYLLDVAVDGELTGSEGTDHEETGTNTAVRTTETELLGDLDQTAGGSLSGKALGLVDLREHSVGGLRDKSGGETGNKTRSEVDGGLHTRGKSVLVDTVVDGLSDLLEHDELGHGVRDPADILVLRNSLAVNGRNRIYLLLEQDGTETSVESAKTLVRVDLAHTADKAVGVGRVGHETDTGSLKRAEGNVGEELGAGGRGKVDGSAVVDSVLVADHGDGLLLEEFVTTELEGTLEEVTSKGWANAGKKSAGTLLCDDLTETTNETTVVGDGVKLDSGLDAVGKEIQSAK